uniref:CSON007379 protein n=1 Tax=Culicoides sonorensis TaxID=179676 RepID=A0A336LMY9_CULSO
MDSNLPVSLFKNNSNEMQIINDEIDEEEENEDQLRRHNELVANLEKYLQIDDDTIDQFEKSTKESLLEYENQPRHENELCRLRNELISKNNEIETLTRMLNDEKQKINVLQNDYQKKLQICEAEKERAIMTKNQTHELLIESKTQLSNLHNHTEELKHKIVSIEAQNSNLTIELQQTKTMLADLQHKHFNLDISHKTNIKLDNNIKQLQEKYNAQVEIMQNQIDGLSSKLDDKEHIVKKLEQRCNELERIREGLFTEKTDIINELTDKLEDQQNEIQKISYLSQRVMKLEHKNKVLGTQNEDLEMRNLELLTELNSMKSELSRTKVLQDEQTKDIKMANECNLVNKEQNQGPKKKINQNSDCLRIMENEATLIEEDFRKMQQRLVERLKNLEEEELKMRGSHDQSIEKSLITHLKNELAYTLKDCERVKSLYITTYEDKQALLKELQNLKNPTKDEITKSCINCKKNNSINKNIKSDLFDLKSLTNDYSREIESLRQHQKENEILIEDLKRKIALQDYHDDLIVQLKKKADQFEQFINITKVPLEVVENSTQTNDSLSEMSLLQVMAKKYAIELKTTEKSYKDKIQNHENLQASLKQELQDLNEHLKIKNNEIETLKCIILKERVKIKEVIIEKEKEAKNLLDHQTQILQHYQKKILDLVQELNDKSDLINAERESVILLQKQLVDIKLAFSKREAVLLENIESKDLENNNNFLQLKEKYQCAKRTAQNYKTYSEEKEKHMVKEYTRLKEGYKEAVKNLEDKLAGLLKENEEKYNKRLHDVKMEYLEKLKEFKSTEEISSPCRSNDKCKDI